MSDVTSLQGPVEKIEGKLTLFIPIAAGEDQFIECSRGIGEVEGEYLRITIPEWLSGMLGIEEGSIVSVDNEGEKFNIHPVAPLPLQ